MGIPGRASVDRSEYRQYIQSKQWRRVRSRFLASKLPSDCARCGALWTSGFHLHHRTYKNLGNERLMDLIPLCPNDHAELHRLWSLATPSTKRKGLWEFTKKFTRTTKIRLTNKIYWHSRGRGGKDLDFPVDLLKADPIYRYFNEEELQSLYLAAIARYDCSSKEDFLYNIYNHKIKVDTVVRSILRIGSLCW